MYNLRYYRETHPRYLNKSEWSAEEDTKEEPIPPKKEEPEVFTSTPELWAKGGPDSHHPQVTGRQGQEIGEVRNMTREVRAANSCSTPAMDHLTTNQQMNQGPKHDTAGNKFYIENSFENIDLNSNMPLYSKGYAFTQGTAKSGGVIKEHPTPSSKYHAKSGGVIKEHPTPLSKYHANLNNNNMFKDNANTNETKGKKVIKETLAPTMSPGIYSNNSQSTSKQYKLGDGKGRKGAYFDKNLTVEQNITNMNKKYDEIKTKERTQKTGLKIDGGEE